MDNLTHSLLGLLLGRVSVPKHLYRRNWISVVAANAPDLDLLASPTPTAYLTAHRHLTHAVVAIPVMAACAVGLVWWGESMWRRRRPNPSARQIDFRLAWFAALLPAASHPLMDWMNSYAIRPWLPFDGGWVSGNLLFVIDPWLWALLAVGVFLPVVLRWGVLGKDRAAVLTIAVLAGYIGWQSDLTAEARRSTLSASPPEARTAAVFPVPLEVRRRIPYIDAGDYHLLDGVRYDKPARRDLVDAAWATPMGRSYRRFALYPMEWVDRHGDGWRVRLGDARFMRMGRPGFLCSFELDAEGRVLNSNFEF